MADEWEGEEADQVVCARKLDGLEMDECTAAAARSKLGAMRKKKWSMDGTHGWTVKLNQMLLLFDYIHFPHFIMHDVFVAEISQHFEILFFKTQRIVFCLFSFSTRFE